MKIERGVELPEQISKRFVVGPLPLSEMQPGDSLLIEVELDDAELSRVLHSLRVRLGRFHKKNPRYRFSSSKDPKGKGIRIWRV